MTGHTHKTTAKALEWRGLVSVSKKGGTWRAELTAVGIYYLEHGDYPADHWDKKPTAVRTKESTTPVPRDEQPKPTEPRIAKPPPRLRPVDQLIADLVQAGGVLQIQRSPQEGPDYDRLVASAIRHGKVPDGKLLVIERRNYWDKTITIKLADPPTWTTAVLQPVPVPEKPAKWHPAVIRLRDAEDRLPMKRPLRNRALRILNTLALTAEAKGYKATTGTPSEQRGYGRRNEVGAELQISILEHPFAVSIVEPTDKVPHEATASELRKAERDSWVRIPKYDHVPSGRLTLTITNGRPYRQSNWTYKDDTVIDLAQVVQELELRAADAEEKRLAAERQAAEKQRQWEAAMTTAKAAYADTRRAEVLEDQLRRWRSGLELDEYLVAMQRHIETITDVEEAAASAQWLDWAISYRIRMDPFRGTLQMPPIPKPSAEALKPYLGRWSYWGP
ncbi:hypothetical protein [Nocardia sp. SYP-A9097]|uniref:hypothetical protein n=1 Tax=Nocardia sp. SYP-A9097 TaxID=2663237 RepID=UPI00129B50A0|nr:hypothetical protein [Nocardia sp. SYP-A9097]